MREEAIRRLYIKLYILLFGIIISGQLFSQGSGNTRHPEKRKLSILVNQVGYDVNGEKILVVQMSDSLKKEIGPDFKLIGVFLLKSPVNSISVITWDLHVIT